MPNLYEVIYVSRRAEGLTDADVVDRIVLPAGRKNRLLDITGCIWFDASRFVQVLEGPREDVERVYEQIQADERHTDIRTLSAGPIAIRSFDRWGMRAVTGESGESIDDLVDHFSNRGLLRDPALPPDPASPGMVGRIRDRLARMAGMGPDATAEV